MSKVGRNIYERVQEELESINGEVGNSELQNSILDEMRKHAEILRRHRENRGAVPTERMAQGIDAKDLYVTKMPIAWLIPALNSAPMCIGLALYL